MENNKNNINNRLPRLYHSLEKLKYAESWPTRLYNGFWLRSYPVHNWARSTRSASSYGISTIITSRTSQKMKFIWALCISNVANVVDWSEGSYPVEAVPFRKALRLLYAPCRETDRRSQSRPQKAQNKPLAHYLGYCRSFIDGYHWFIRNNMLIGERKMTEKKKQLICSILWLSVSNRENDFQTDLDRANVILSRYFDIRGTRIWKKIFHPFKLRFVKKGVLIQDILWIAAWIQIFWFWVLGFWFYLFWVWKWADREVIWNWVGNMRVIGLAMLIIY